MTDAVQLVVKTIEALDAFTIETGEGSQINPAPTHVTVTLEGADVTVVAILPVDNQPPVGEIFFMALSKELSEPGEPVIEIDSETGLPLDHIPGVDQ